jgi:protein-disulfide isomerase
MESEIRKLISISGWFISLQVVTLLAFLGGAAVLHLDLRDLKQKAASIGGPNAESALTDVKDWPDYVRGHDAAIGDPAAKIVVIEFTDFQCPYCKQFEKTTRSQLLSKYGDQVRLILKHYPLERIHPDAKNAAVAAQCAQREGKFWQIKDAFFGRSRLSAEFLIAAGMNLGLGERYANCVTNQETLADIEEDIEDGMKIGIQGTPTFLINGKVAVGALSLARFESIIGAMVTSRVDKDIGRTAGQ